MIANLRTWTGKPGESGQRLYMWCPGCNEVHGIEIDPKNTPCWQWDGNLEAPTISTSILRTGVQWAPGETFHKPTHAGVEAGQEIRCHSFVRAGCWEFLGDCTHHLTGQTVPLPELPEFWSDRKARS